MDKPPQATAPAKDTPEKKTGSRRRKFADFDAGCRNAGSWRRDTDLEDDEKES